MKKINWFVLLLAVLMICMAGCGAQTIAPEADDETNPPQDAKENSEMGNQSSEGESVVTYNTDIVIVGGGASGLAAAIEAAPSGADIIVLEKNAMLGGSLFMSEGMFAVESHWQKELGYNYTKDEAFQEIVEYHHMRNDARIVREFVERSADTIDWMENNAGVTFLGVGTTCMATEANRPAGDKYLDMNYWHMFDKQGGAREPMVKAAEDAGVTVLLETPGKKLIMDGDTCVGVEAVNSNGEKIIINAKATIIATGGFGSNGDMITEYTICPDGNNICFPGFAGHDGDGVNMAWEAGAEKGQIGIFTMGTWIDEYGESYGVDLNTVSFQPHLWVNKNGIRYTNEENQIPLQYGGTLLFNQPDQKQFIIFDQKILDTMSTEGIDLGQRNWPHDPAPITTLPESIEAGAVNGRTASGATIEELAANAEDVMGVDAENLLATIEEYNQMCADGHDYWFNKRSEYLRPIEEGPFYIVMNDNSHLGTLGGIKINEKCEVLRKDDQKVIPGLYAAGMDASSIFGEVYDFTVSGEATAVSIITGRIAGEFASKYIK